MRKHKAARIMNDGFWDGAPRQKDFAKACKKFSRAVRRRIARGSHLFTISALEAGTLDAMKRQPAERD